MSLSFFLTAKSIITKLIFLFVNSISSVATGNVAGTANAKIIFAYEIARVRVEVLLASLSPHVRSSHTASS